MEFIPLALSIVAYIVAKVLDERDSLWAIDLDRILAINRRLRQ